MISSIQRVFVLLEFVSEHLFDATIYKPAHEKRVLITQLTSRGFHQSLCCSKTCSRDLEEASGKNACL